MIMEKNTSLKGKVGKDCVLIFLHIGKTAGSTLHRILEEQYSDTGHFFTVGGLENKDGKKFSTLTRKERDKIGVIRGHLNFGVHELIEKPAVYITMLRDPVDRIISTYYYLKRDKGHYLHDICRSDGWTLEDFVFYKPTEIMNGQTRVLAGVSDVYSFFKMGRESVPLGKCDDEILETAKRNLKKFAVVGLMERFDKTMILLKRSLGWETPPLYIK